MWGSIAAVSVVAMFFFRWLGQTRQQRLFAFELRRCGYAARGRETWTSYRLHAEADFP
jgi:hypothetical protein